MELKNIKIEPETFYKVGFWCFTVIFFMQIGNFFYLIEFQNFFTTISTIAGLIFNATLALFFRYLWTQSAPQMSEEYASDDIEDIIKEVKKKGKNEKRGRKK